MEDPAGDPKEIKKQVIEQSRDDFRVHQASSTKAISAFRSAAKKALTKTSSGNKKGSALGDNPERPKLTTLLRELVSKSSEGHCNIDILAKPGPVPANGASFCRLPGALASAVEQTPGFAAHAKWLSKQMAKDETMTTAMASYKPSVGKHLFTAFKAHAPDLFPNVPVPSENEGLKEEVFGPQHWVQAESHWSVGINPYGLTDTRILIMGSYLLAAVKSTELIGSTLQEKVERILTDAGMREFFNKCAQKDAGFWGVHDEPYTAMVIPSDHVVIMSGNFEKGKDGSQGVRWGFMNPPSAADCKRTVDNLKGMIQMYLDLKTSGYEAWQGVISKYLLPGASCE